MKRTCSRLLLGLAAALLALTTMPASAALKALACEPEWGALLQELAGDKVQAYVATTALQDPHHIQAKPSLLAAARGAELVVCTGVELEVGWLPVLLRQSGDRKSTRLNSSHHGSSYAVFC